MNKTIKKHIFKIIKIWYVEADDIIDLKKDKLVSHRKEADEIRIVKVRDF